jgi:hypothetical protein
MVPPTADSSPCPRASNPPPKQVYELPHTNTKLPHFGGGGHEDALESEERDLPNGHPHLLRRLNPPDRSMNPPD